MTATDYDAEMLELDRWREAGKEIGRKIGVVEERERVIKLLQNHNWFEQGEKDEVLAILDGSYKCECDGCIAFIKGENN